MIQKTCYTLFFNCFCDILTTMKREHILAIDMDGTLFHSNIVVAFGKWLFRNNQIGYLKITVLAFLWLLYHIYVVPFRFFSKVTYRLIFSNQSREKLIKLFQHFLYETKHKLENKTVLKKLQDAQNIHSVTLLVTRSPKFLAEVVASIYNITHCFGTEFYTNNSSIQVVEMTGVKKLAAVRSILKEYDINQSNITAISDNKDDMILLKNVSKGYFIKNNQLHNVTE